MSLETELFSRSGGCCECCEAAQTLQVYEILPKSTRSLDTTVFLCSTCVSQINGTEAWNSEHWKCLTKTMWSEHVAIKVISWRMLQRSKAQSWAADALDMLYLSDEELSWAKAFGDEDYTDTFQVHKDGNGTPLQHGDTVVLIKTLDVKGSSVQAKVGTAVKNIRLVLDDTDQIEGKIDGQQIVILTKFVKKA
jgi:protein PhnA